MKITKSQLRQIIKEELKVVLSEGARADAAYERLSPEAKELWQRLEAIATEQGYARTVGAPHRYVRTMSDLGVPPELRSEIMRYLEAMYGLDEGLFGLGSKAKRTKELEGFVEQYDVRGFLTQLMRAVTSGDRVPDELEGLADLASQDSATQRQQLKTMIRQGGALQSFADSLPGDWDDAVGVIENIVQEDPQMFNKLMRDAAAKIGPMASPEQRLRGSHR